MKLLNRFDAYTIQSNSEFKVAFGDIVVSVSCHNYLDAYKAMEGNGIVGQNIDFSKMPRDLMLLTFNANNVEIYIFNQETDECLSAYFCDNADDYDGIIYGATPVELVDILIRVRDYVSSNSK